MTIGALIFALLTIAYVLQVLKLRSDLADERESKQVWKDRAYEIQRLAAKRDWQFFSLMHKSEHDPEGWAHIMAQIAYYKVYPEATEAQLFDWDTCDLTEERQYTRV